jgi:hypothetical protein
MAGKKIGELTPLGRNLISTDELELSLVGSTGSRKVTGAQIISATGVHAILPIGAGGAISCQVNGLATTSAAVASGTIRAIPFIPSTLVTSVSLSINVTTLFAGANGRILIYSNLNGKPDQKIFESANLDCSTLGTKTALLSYNFIPGETYWLCTHFSSSGVSATLQAVGSLINIANSLFSAANSYSLTAPFGSAPTTFGVGTLSTATMPAILINT